MLKKNLIFLSLLAFSCSSENINKVELMPSHNDYFISEDYSNQAFSHHVKNMSFEEAREFFSGESFFDQNWIIAPSSVESRDGLGPNFNARSCASCHVKDGRGAPPKENETALSLLIRLSIPGKGENNSPIPDPIYGNQLQTFSIPNMTKEGELNISYTEKEYQFNDGEKYKLAFPKYEIKNLGFGPLHKDILLSPRVAPQMTGLGLLEAIEEGIILKNSDPNDNNKDGISGKPNYVWDIEKKSKVLGRFGWKSNQPSVRQQVAGAFSGDLGITSSLFPKENLTDFQIANSPKFDSGGNPEISDSVLDKTSFYARNLAVPKIRNTELKEMKNGEKLFNSLNCSSCHITSFKVGNYTIKPFTDLLLHDMGEDLSDNRSDFEAEGREWRTPPLWGIGLVKTVNGHTNFLHDGRARSLLEAVLWHGGEAEKSKNEFKKLSKNERNDLIKFLESL